MSINLVLYRTARRVDHTETSMSIRVRFSKDQACIGSNGKQQMSDNPSSMSTTCCHRIFGGCWLVPRVALHFIGCDLAADLRCQVVVIAWVKYER